MARPMARASLTLTPEQRSMLTELAGSRVAPHREVERAQVLLAYAAGKTPTQIQRAIGVSRPTIYKCIDKALAAGVVAGLRDRYHRPHAPQITDVNRYPFGGRQETGSVIHGRPVRSLVTNRKPAGGG